MAPHQISDVQPSHQRFWLQIHPYHYYNVLQMVKKVMALQTAYVNVEFKSSLKFINGAIINLGDIQQIPFSLFDGIFFCNIFCNDIYTSHNVEILLMISQIMQFTTQRVNEKASLAMS